ncbi:hypothetical protein Q4595_19585, partial [Wenyingzhuangia sp. 1_MG-2023]|nr:hypothetical protein [Wenyingzhuangia sp. 1_MG-2023]
VWQTWENGLNIKGLGQAGGWILPSARGQSEQRIRAGKARYCPVVPESRALCHNKWHRAERVALLQGA